MIALFIVAAMCFFLYVETAIVISKNITLVEKLISFVCFALLELYYIMQLCERLGL